MGTCGEYGVWSRKRVMKHHSANKTLHPSPAAGNIRQYLIKGDMHTTFFFFFG